MDSLSDSRFRGGIVLALVLLNLALLFYVGWGMNGNSPRPPMGENRDRKNPKPLGIFIQQELDLRPDQVAQYQDMIKRHQIDFRSTNQEIRQLKKALFSSLDKSEEEIDSLSKQIGGVLQTKEMLTYQHFADLRAICDPDQQKKLDAVLLEVLLKMDRRGPPPRNGGPPPRNGRKGGPPPF